MSEGLGSIFDAATPGPGPRGPDMSVDVEVPRVALGTAEGYGVVVPAQIEIDGRTVARRIGPGESDGIVRLHLPADFRDGAVLRLRAQGGMVEGGSAGDLLVTVRIIEPLANPRWPWLIGAALVLGAGGVWLALAQ